MEFLKRKNFYQTITIFIWLLFLFIIESTGNLKIYIKKNYISFTILGSFILLFLFLIKIKRFKKELPEKIDFLSTLSFLIFLFPVILAIVVKPGNLPTFAASKRGITQEFLGKDLLETLKTELETEGKYKKLNIKQLLAFAKNKPEEIDNKLVSVVGFVFKQNGEKDKFTLVRFLITCCAADAIPLGIEVVYDQTEQLKQDTWVKVYGNCVVEKNKPKIIAEDVKEEQKPSDFYLY